MHVKTVAHGSVDLLGSYKETARSLVNNLTTGNCRMEFSRNVIKEVSKLGWAGICIPTFYGGSGLGHLHRFLSIEALSSLSPSAGVVLQSVQLGTAIFMNADEQQKEYWLPKLASGEEVATICITESISGSNINRMSTAVKLHDKSLELNGRKRFIVNSHVASVHGVISKFDYPDLPRKYAGLIVPASLSGCSPGMPDGIHGLHGVNIGEVIFDKCQIDFSTLVIREVDGIALAHRSITIFGKLNLAAVAVGCLSNAIELTTSFLDSEIGRRKDLASVDAIRRHLSDAERKLLRIRHLCYSAAQSIDDGVPNEGLIMTAKIDAVRGAISGILDCMGVFGARGGLVETGLTSLLLDVLQLMPPAGTESVNLKRLAQVALGEYKMSGWVEC